MTNPDYTHLLLIADRSGSMQSIAEDMNGGIRALLEEHTHLEGKLLVDAWRFDEQIEHAWDGIEPFNAMGLPDLIVPRGATALNDAIGRAVTTLGEDLAELPEEVRPGKVLVVIVTDGMENASQEFTASTVKALVTQQTETYGWDFIFLGANIDAFSVGSSFGVSQAQTMNYAPSSAGVRASTQSVSSYLRSTRSGVSASISTAEREAAMET